MVDEKHIGSDLDDFLAEDGILEDVEQAAKDRLLEITKQKENECSS